MPHGDEKRIQDLFAQAKALIAEMGEAAKTLSPEQFRERFYFNSNPIEDTATRLEQGKSIRAMLDEMMTTEMDPQALLEVAILRAEIDETVKLLKVDWDDEFRQTFPGSN